MRKLLVISVLHFLLCSGLIAQEFGLPPLTNYQHNWMVLNPAFAGTREAGSANLFLLSKPGADEAPGPWYTQVSFHTPTKDEKVALGVSYYNKQTPIQGLFNWDPIITEHSFYFNYAYRIWTGGGRLAFGLSGGISTNALSKANLDLLHTGDNAFQLQEALAAEDYIMRALPNVGTGVLFYTEKYFVGVSVPRFFSFKDGQGGSIVNFRKISPIVSGGYEFVFSENFTLNPSGMLQINPGDPLGYAIGLNTAFLDEQFWLGVVYKTGNTFSLNFNVEINPKLLVGLAYDRTLQNIPNYFSGAYELIIRYEMVNTIKSNIPFYY